MQHLARKAARKSARLLASAPAACTVSSDAQISVALSVAVSTVAATGVEPSLVSAALLLPSPISLLPPLALHSPTSFEVIQILSTSPPPRRLHPFFTPQTHLLQSSVPLPIIHEVLFNAVRGSQPKPPFPPSLIPPVSTLQHESISHHVAPNVSHVSLQNVVLPLGRGRLKLPPKVNRDTVVPSYTLPITVACSTCDSAVQTSPRPSLEPLTLQDVKDSAVQTSPRFAPEPLTLQDLKAEMRAMLVGLGF